MQCNNLKSIGKIYDFDGEAGTIVTTDKEYIFNLDNVRKTQNIKANDFVAFYPSTVKFGNEIFNVAREIEALTKDEIKSLHK